MGKKDLLLEQVITQYIKLKEPIGSESLKATCGNSFSSATIRNYFKLLVAEGWLSQPHISSGRIPTTSALKAHWRKCIDSKSPCVITDLTRLKNASFAHQICAIVCLEQANKLQKIQRLNGDLLLLVFERAYAVMPYSATLERFLQELCNLDITDIKKIAYQVRARELLDTLDSISKARISRFCVCALKEMLEFHSNEEAFLDIVDGLVFHKLQNGIYFEEILPSNYLGVMQDVHTAQGNGHIFCVGTLDRDFSKFYDDIAS